MKLIVITSPEIIKDEALICNSLFARGLELLHLRKPGSSEDIYEDFLRQVEPRFRNRVVIHEYYDLARKYQLRGLHLKSVQAHEYMHYRHFRHISISCHSTDEIAQLPFRPEYCFLSPVFDSISKQGYKSAFKEIPDLSQQDVPVVALGGITPAHISLCRRSGFSGIAVLGYVWEKPEEAVQRFIRLKTPIVMSIAGFDPSAGAGILADLKAFENNDVYGLGIASAITFQNEEEYEGTCWTSFQDMQRQCGLQFRKHRPEYIKIGLIESFEVLDALTQYLCEQCPGIRIIWDSILKASAGFRFHDSTDENNRKKLKDILNRIYLITPNTEELLQLFSTTDEKSLQKICRQYQLNLLWKGGHNNGTVSTDKLFTPAGIHSFPVRRGKYGKHGTGCVLSATITALLARNIPLDESCARAQLYVSQFIGSNDSKLGYHHIGTALTTCKPSPRELNIQYITDHKEGMTIGEQIESVCRGGVRWVQLRMKESTEEELLREGRLAGEICQRYNALFIVNDNVQAARQLDADGVHLGREDMNPLEARKILGEGKIIGATCNTWEDIIRRAMQQVDYIGLGPFTFTTTKKKLSPVLGLEGYRQLLRLMEQSGIYIPVFAIGGITEPDIAPLMETGIQGIALSGLIKNSNNLINKTKEIITSINGIY